MIPSNNAYKHIASYYDKSTNLRVFKIYKSILGKINNFNILDLGCGTGTLLKHYSSNNETYGIDGSPEMIKIAKSKDKKSTYKIGDIRNFKINKKFDIICCTYDTINHLPSLKNWGKLFKNVSAQLSSKGLFIFDYNTVEGLKNCSGTILQKIGKNYVVRDVKNTNQACLWEFHNFVKKSSGLFEYKKSVIKEVSYPNKLIEKEIRKYFKIVDIVKNDKSRIYIKTMKKATK